MQIKIEPQLFTRHYEFDMLPVTPIGYEFEDRRRCINRLSYQSCLLKI